MGMSLALGVVAAALALALIDADRGCAPGGRCARPRRGAGAHRAAARARSRRSSARRSALERGRAVRARARDPRAISACARPGETIVRLAAPGDREVLGFLDRNPERATLARHARSSSRQHLERTLAHGPARRGGRPEAAARRSRSRSPRKQGARGLRVQRRDGAREAAAPARRARSPSGSPSGSRDARRAGRARGGRGPRLREHLARAIALAGPAARACSRRARATARADAGAGQRVQVEFVSANPTGPLTLGHGRQAVLGDCIARLLEATGYDVTREYYFNNGGRQMRVLGESVRARYLELLGRAAPPPPEALADASTPGSRSVGGLPVAFPSDGYQGEYIREIAARPARAHGEALVDEPGDGVFRETAETQIFARDPRDARRARHRASTSTPTRRRSTSAGDAERVLADLARAGLRLRAGRRALVPRHRARARARPRAGEEHAARPTYLLPDVAYHREKFARGFDLVIDVQGADHKEQFPFVRRGAGALGCPVDRLELVMHQFVTLTRGGEQVKQSTRRATYVTVDEVLERGRRRRVPLLHGAAPRREPPRLRPRPRQGHRLDEEPGLLRAVRARAHARRSSARRASAASRCPTPRASTPSALVLPEEIELLKQDRRVPRGGAARRRRRASRTTSPTTLRELAGLWNPYLQDGMRHRVLSDDAALTSARLGLALAVRIVARERRSRCSASRRPERM